MTEHEEPAPLLDTKPVLIQSALLEDLQGYAGMGELLGKALRGEIQLKPPPPPRRHRCLACWLISLLPGHDRCEHGYLTCDECDHDRW